ncbi:MAG: site-2 protease family protein [Clostridiales bacterium]|jgi:Zn-dependent protease|nr:site-2 protease family protein [Clostridiales bacterium]
MLRNFDLLQFLVRLPVLLISFTIHEFAHGLSAYLLGDSTAKLDGRLSLNPIRHIDPIGALMILFIGIGWAKPVMVSTDRLKNPKGDLAIISFCGPLSNFILAFIFILLYVPASFYLLPQDNAIHRFIIMFIEQGFMLNIALGVFNMLPIPPLDGLKVFASILPDRLYNQVMYFNARVGMVLFLVLAATGLLSRIITPIDYAVMNAYFKLAGKIFSF